MRGDKPKGSVHSESFSSILTSRSTRVFLLTLLLTIYIFGYAGYGFYSKMELTSRRGQKSNGTTKSEDKNTTGTKNPYVVQHGSGNEIGLVVAKSREEDAELVERLCKYFGCTPYIYSVSEQPEPEFLQPYTITGHEASAYLTYLVQHYHDLHPYTIFVHGSDGDSNSDIGEQRILDQLPDLRFQAVDHSGFVSLHCPSFQNCPINPTFSNTQETNVGSQDLVDDFPQIWSEIFALDSSTAPIQLGNQGSSQFMVTKERIQQEPPAYYSRILHWVATTGWSDSDGIASLMEQLWHIIFGMPAENCQAVEQCRCDLYGWCGPNPRTSGEVLTPVQ